MASFYSRNFDDFAKYEPLIRKQAYSMHYQHKVLEYEEKYRQERTRIRYYMFQKYDPFRTIGTVSFRELNKDGKGSAIVGYKVDIGFRRRGYARESLSALIPAVEKEYGLHRVEAEVLPDNRASQNLLSGLGFRRCGLLESRVKINGVSHDEYLYIRED